MRGNVWGDAGNGDGMGDRLGLGKIRYLICWGTSFFEGGDVIGNNWRGSTFETTDILKFGNFEYLNNEKWDSIRTLKIYEQLKYIMITKLETLRILQIIKIRNLPNWKFSEFYKLDRVGILKILHF